MSRRLAAHFLSSASQQGAHAPGNGSAHRQEKAEAIRRPEEILSLQPWSTTSSQATNSQGKKDLLGEDSWLAAKADTSKTPPLSLILNLEWPWKMWQPLS